MVEGGSAPRDSLGEEIASSIVHGVGALLAVAGLAVLTAFASLRGSAWHVVGCSLFGLTLILLYTSSTLYHSIPQPRPRRSSGPSITRRSSSLSPGPTHPSAS